VLIFQRIESAQRRLEEYAHVTPVMTSATLNWMTAAQVYFKCENFQKIGVFKFRGAFNSLSRLSSLQRKRGVLTYSSGNHGQAVALRYSELLSITGLMEASTSITAWWNYFSPGSFSFTC
jgi:threonine dehydratase